MKTETSIASELETAVPREKFLSMQCGHARIAVTSDPISLPRNLLEQHDHFEFFIPLSSVVSAHINKKKIECHSGDIIIINPEQKHGVNRGVRSASFMTLFFPEKYMRNLIGAMSPDIDSFPNEVFRLKPEIQKLIMLLVEEFRENRPDQDILLAALSEHLAVMLIREYLLPSVSPTTEPEETLNQQQLRFAEIVKHMNQHLDDKLTIEQLAEMSSMNRFHFIRSFKTAFGSSPYDYLTALRIDKAKTMLGTTRLSVNDVGRSCGFFSASRFSAAFRSLTGMTPSKYRQYLKAERKHLNDRSNSSNSSNNPE